MSDEHGQATPPRRLVAAALAAAAALTALQLFAAFRLELTFDEAYYALWSRSLAFGYLDHPPMVAALIRASTALFGGSEAGVRGLGLILIALTPALIALIAWRLFRDAAVAALAALFFVAAPLAAGAVFVTPDTPLLVFWTLALAALSELWRRGEARWLLAAGAALGLALDSKFTAFFLAAGVLAALGAAPSLRRWLRAPALIGATVVAAALFAPVVWWNAGHDWATFAKQFGRAPPHGFAPFYLAEFLAAQFGLMNPLVFAAFVAAFAAVGWRVKPAPGSAGEARLMLAASIAPAILYFLIHALHDRVQGNWPAPLYPAAAILAAEWAARRFGAPGWRGVLARSQVWAAPLGLAAAALGLAQATVGLVPLGARDPAARLQGFAALAEAVDGRARAEHAGFVLTRGYALTSLMTYYGDPGLAVVQPDERLRWAFAPAPPEALFAAPGLALADDGAGFETDLAKRFARVERIATLERRRREATLGRYALYRIAEPNGPVLPPP